ncbi:orotidine-5'-phosphate decarboxylase [Candidatus Kaiserbacteria bacterium]|nr:orotidine-5'-phosphate decarboxylase [Candidatus Kaiserbacteria bacterium]
MERNFRDLLEAQWDAGKFLSVGLDSDFSKIPASARVEGVRETLVNFNVAIVNATRAVAGSYKLNSAFYEAHGELGWTALQETVEYIHGELPDMPVILDAKRADIGNTNDGYVQALFERLNADAVTVHPYLGGEALAPFLKNPEKGVFVLCRTSNPGAGEFQDLESGGKPLYMHVAERVRDGWNANKNCGLVVGATYPEEMKKIRAVADDMPFLIPGIGAQGGDLEKTVASGRDSRGKGFVIAASRAIIFASGGDDFAEVAGAKAAELSTAIQAAL